MGSVLWLLFSSVTLAVGWGEVICKGYLYLKFEFVSHTEW